MGLELGLSLLLVPMIGYIGVGVAYVIMTLISQAVCYFYLLRKADVRIDLSSFLKPWLFFIVLAAAYLALRSDALGWRIALLAAYTALCVLFIPDCRQSLLYLWKMGQELRWRKANPEVVENP
jgi:O-antigen/teichoic acid export membrane protein